VDYQADHICDCIPARIPQALAELPKTLDETYERTLRGINETNWEFAHRMFQFVSVASRPLRVEELADLLAFDFEAGSIPKFHEDWRLEDPVNVVLSTCSTLLAIVNDQGSPVVQFSHFSVKQFLTSARLAEATDVTSRHYHVSMTPAHTLVAQACLGILLHLDKDVTSDSLKDFPLAEYAAEHWVDHARFENVSRNVEDGMKQLFDPSKPHLAICVWIYDPAVPTQDRMTRNETPLPLPQTSLHYAASWGLNSVVESLIVEHSQDVCSRDSTDHATPLHLASRNGHLKAACTLIEHSANARAQNNNGETPLHFASQMGHVDVARMLIERGAGADVNAPGGSLMTPLHLTAYHGKVGVAELLLECGAEVDARDEMDQTPLHFAAQQGHLELVRLLLEHHADVLALNREDHTFLDVAWASGYKEIVDINARYEDGQTALHIAAQHGDTKLMSSLIYHELNPIDPNVEDEYQETPLFPASRNGKLEATRLLLDADANPNHRDWQEMTPLHMASEKGHAAVTQLLLDRGAEVDAENAYKWTPLHLASQAGKFEATRVLVHGRATVNAQNDYGWTPLHLASKRGSLDVAESLLTHAPDVNIRNEDGEAAIHLAAFYGHLEVAQGLLKNGAFLDSENKEGKTARDLASREGHLDIAQLRESYGEARGAPLPEVSRAPTSVTQSSEEPYGEERGAPPLPSPRAPTSRVVPEHETYGHIPPGSVTQSSEEAYGEERGAPLPGVSRAPTSSGPGAPVPLPEDMLGLPPEGAESIVASIRRASTESYARHADDIRDIVQAEREEMARQLQAAREEARTAREALEQQVPAERTRADEERDARMRELKEELARVWAELDHEKQQRDYLQDAILLALLGLILLVIPVTLFATWSQ
jgi:ankyrin repeat protein